MDLESMELAIQEYCDSNSLDCESCLVEDICDSIVGDFARNPKECEDAYNLLVEHGICSKDNVNQPIHYTFGGMECIDIMEIAFGTEAVEHFCLCNLFKYVYRHDHKNGKEDIEKAVWYLNKYKELKYGVVDNE